MLLPSVMAWTGQSEAEPSQGEVVMADILMFAGPSVMIALPKA